MFRFIKHALVASLISVSSLTWQVSLAYETQPVYQIDVVTELLEPYQIQQTDGTLSGFSTEVIHALFAQANSDANIKVMPWARAYEVARSTPNVMIYSIAHTRARDTLFHWVGSLKEERLFFWGLKSKFPEPVENIEQLKSLKVAASRLSNVAQYLHDNKFKHIYELIKEDQNMLMLYRDRVDLIVATELTLQNRAEKLGLDFDKMQRIQEVKELNNDLSIAFNKGTESNVVDHFRQAFNTISANGTISQIRAKWHISE